jgi:electron transfer flavoprotein alpha/beta subunit
MMIGNKNDQCELDIKKFDDAITALVAVVTGQNVPREPYYEQVYKAARKVVKAYP